MIELDAQEREALRADIETEATALSDVRLCVKQGDRDEVLRLREHLDRLIGALDAIGWTEELAEPDRQPVGDVDALRAYAERSLPQLEAALRYEEMTPGEQADRDLLALSVMRRVIEAR